jgi:hypothetical protein
MKMNRMLVAAGLAAVMCLCAGEAFAQGGGRGGRGGRGGGNFDPAQMEQMRLDRYHQELEVTDNAEWNVLQPLIKKVMDAQTQARSGGGRGMGGRNGRGGNPADDGTNTDATNQGGVRRIGGRMGGTPSPEADALQKALDAKASSAELKTALARYADSRKTKQAALEQAQAELRKVLTVRQEAIASLNGLL